MEKHRFFSFYTREHIIYVRFRPEGVKTWGHGHSTGFDNLPDAEFSVRAYLEGLRPDFRKNSSPARVVTAEEFLSFERFFHELRTLPFTPEHARRIEEILEARKLKGEALVAYPTLVPFLLDFWNFETSKYVAGLKTRGHRISKRHCYDQGKHVANHWARFFPIQRIDEVTLRDLEAFALDLKKRDLTGKSINNTLNAGLVALKWAAKRDLIPSDPTRGFEKFAVHSKPRGVLTPEEAKQLFNAHWPDERARLGNLLAATCGLRSGEVLALRHSSLASEDGRTFVAQSWNRHDLFTDPKWGSFRDTSIDQAIRSQLLAISAQSPFSQDGADFLIFHGERHDQPRDGAYLLDALKEQLYILNPDKDYWRSRKVDFHSWRHFFTSRMSEKLDDPTLMKATGHKSKDAFDEYANHLTPEQFRRVREAQDQIFLSSDI